MRTVSIGQHIISNKNKPMGFKIISVVFYKCVLYKQPKYLPNTII